MFTIEDLIEQIPEQKTKNLFQEVYSSYSMGNYRSAVVMLWSVVICDLIYKLQYLRDVYADASAISILDAIEKVQEANPNSPDWENILVEEIFQRTKFLSTSEKTNIDYLHKQRHLCAHPIITDSNLLLKPSKEMTRSLMRTSLEGILLKTPLLTKEFIDIITNDLDEKRVRLYDYEMVQQYLETKYLKVINENQVISLMKALWRFIYNPRSEQEKTNQWINFVTLLILFEKYTTACITEIQKSPERFTFQDADETSCLYFIDLLKRYPNLFGFIDESTKILVRAIVDTDNLAKFAPCVFLSDNILLHLNKIIERLDNGEAMYSIEQDGICELKDAATSINELTKFYEICIKNYCNSGSFASADKNFNLFIRPYFKNFSKDQLLLLFELSNKNNQATYRGRGDGDHSPLLNQFISLGGIKVELASLGYWNRLLEEIN